MRIHADNLTAGDVWHAADTVLQRTGAPFHLDMTVRGSRSRARAFDVVGTSDGTLTRKRTNPGTGGGNRGYSATWEQWGWFLAALFAKDDTVTIPRVYADAADFHDKTDDRFDTDLEA